jgi:hypothetical protein
MKEWDEVRILLGSHWLAVAFSESWGVYEWMSSYLVTSGGFHCIRIIK